MALGLSMGAKRALVPSSSMPGSIMSGLVHKSQTAVPTNPALTTPPPGGAPHVQACLVNPPGRQRLLVRTCLQARTQKGRLRTTMFSSLRAV